MMVSQDWLDRYFTQHVERRLQVWGPAVDPVLAGRMRTYLRQGLKRLNSIPSDDPFWANTNREPTLYKMGCYFSKNLDRHNEDHVWIVASCLLLQCADRDLGWLLQPLLDQDFATVEWIVAAGLWIRTL